MKKLTSSHGCKSNAKTAKITTVKSMKTAYAGVKKADRNKRGSHRERARANVVGVDRQARKAHN